MWKHRQLLLWLTSFAVVYALLTGALSQRFAALGAATAFSATEIVVHPALFYMYIKFYGRLPYGIVFGELIVGIVFLAGLWIGACRGMAAAMLVAIFYLVFWYMRNRKALRIITRSLPASFTLRYQPTE